MTKRALYEKLVLTAHVFYILLGALWFLFNFLEDGYINLIALSVIAVFGAQAYFKYRVANLVLGIVLLPTSIFWMLQFLWEGGKTGFDLFINIMMLLSIASLVFSAILISSYLKLSFSDD